MEVYQPQTLQELAGGHGVAMGSGQVINAAGFKQAGQRCACSQGSAITSHN